MSTSKILIGSSFFLLALSAIFGVLNTYRTRDLRVQATQSESARQTAEQARVNREKEIKGREAAVAAANAKFGETQTKASAAESALAKTRIEKDELQVKIKANETEIAELRKHVEQTGSQLPLPGEPAASAAAPILTQLEESKRQLDTAEREKVLLSEKVRAIEERAAQPATRKKQRPAGGNPGLRGAILAVNPAYNFVVLNLGGRQGVEANAEMLVLRGGTLIARIRISSVEPATAIGDIITSSLARGVQVQPGDTVIYAGTN